MKEVYNKTGIEYKDYIFAYMCMAPFMVALKPITKLLVPLALGGPSNKGKTPISELIALKIFAHFSSSLGDTVKSSARTGQIISATSFPYIFDDCEDLLPYLTGWFKRYLAGEEEFIRLNKDGSLRLKTFLVGIPIFTYNDYPVFFEDPAMRMRLLNLVINNLIKVDGWTELVDSIPDGMIGSWIIECTKDLKWKELVELYKSQSDKGKEMCENHERADIIIKLMNLGKHFMKEFFDIELDLSLLPLILKDTIRANTDDIIEVVKECIHEGSNFIVCGKEGILENPNRRSWIISRVHKKKYKKQDGYFLSASNVTEIAKRLGKRPEKFKSKRLYNELGTYWGKKELVYKEMSIESKTMRGIFIPEKFVNGIVDDIEYLQREDLLNNHPPI